MSRKTVALIDGDYYLYSVAHQGQKEIFHLTMTVGDKKYYRTVTGRRDRNKYRDFVTEREGTIEIKEDLGLEPVEYILATVKNVHQRVIRDVKADEYIVCLGGETKKSFRYRLATMAPYKDGRPPRPHYYKTIRDYINNNLHVKVSETVEADDLLGIYAMKINAGGGAQAVICTHDKDLNTIPGLHYNLRTRDLVDVTEPEALRFLYTQILMGDATDNIPHPTGLGAKTAEKIIDLVEQTDLQFFESVLYSVCWEVYQRYGYTKDQMHEIARLVYILRDKKMWQPPESIELVEDTVEQLDKLLSSVDKRRRTKGLYVKEN